MNALNASRSQLFNGVSIAKIRQNGEKWWLKECNSTIGTSHKFIKSDRTLRLRRNVKFIKVSNVHASHQIIRMRQKTERQKAYFQMRYGAFVAAVW
eukprot:111234-Pleurochrysis_carterae.AAC.1